MGKAMHVKWVENSQFVGIDSSKHSVVISSQDEEHSIGMKPSDLLLVGPGGCTVYNVVEILEERRQSLTGLNS
jgi:putative redox protein